MAKQTLTFIAVLLHLVSFAQIGQNEMDHRHDARRSGDEKI
jgi:hypothetical protein